MKKKKMFSPIPTLRLDNAPVTPFRLSSYKTGPTVCVLRKRPRQCYVDLHPKAIIIKHTGRRIPDTHCVYTDLR